MAIADGYESASQRARVLTEHWVNSQVYCPNCGHADMGRYGNNKPVADFFCSICDEDYELKSTKSKISNRLTDGAYGSMMDRLKGNKNPNLFLLNYDLRSSVVLNFIVIPKQFFVPDVIEERKPLKSTARRAGWTGCNILLNGIPQTGRIYLVQDCQVETKDRVLAEWQKTLFLREEKQTGARGWLLDVMVCVEKLGNREFALEEVYAFEGSLARKHPENKHIREKIRQQLQVLRDDGFLEFVKRGYYRIAQ